VSGPARRPGVAGALEGRHVRIEPLGPQHVPELAAATAGDEELWRWMPSFPVDEAGMAQVVGEALAGRDSGWRYPFVIVERASGTAVGSSSYLDITPEHARIEIGWTFLSRRVWRTAVNSEAKLLLMGHAFDDLGYERVAFKTHHLNQRSQDAIARLGAVREGVLRHHMLHRDGSWRDSVYFSVLSEQWPAVRGQLVARLAAD
jgi:N-acetyltransferase